ncbi:TENX-like protein, partial [Mya arenaria]
MDECFRRGRFPCDPFRCITKDLLCDEAFNCPFGEDEFASVCILKHKCESMISATEGCLGRCTPGYFGNFCEKTCSKKCLNGICDVQSGICKDCTRTFLENCSLKCGQGCREKENFPQCDRQSGKCLNGCYLYHYGQYCNKTCKNCKGNSSNVSCDIDGVCQSGCENGYWGKKCNTKCSANCLALERQCESKISTTEGCLGRCTPGYFGKFCRHNCSENCLNGICNKSTGICKECTRTFLENCSQQCGPGCRGRENFPQCDRQSGKCLHGCYLYHYGQYCNKTCKNCKGNTFNVSCDIDGECQSGCENGYWGKKCNTKCSANCEGDEHGNR